MTTSSLAAQARLALALAAGFYVLVLSVAAALFYGAARAWDMPVDRGIPILAVSLGVTLLAAAFPRSGRWRAPGPRLHRAQHPRLFREIDQIARAAGEPPPDEVYLVLEVNAWASRRRGAAGLRRRTVMGLGLPLLAGLSVAELRGVIAHEFGHWRAGNTHLAPWVYVTREAIIRTVNGAGLLLRYPFVWYARAFLSVSQRVARGQELAADALAARIAGANAVATGLEAVEGLVPAFVSFWSSDMAASIAAGFRPSISQGFAASLGGRRVAERAGHGLRRAADRRTAPYDTHPALTERVAALGVRLGTAGDPTAPRAVTLLERIDSMEAQLLAHVFEAEKVRKLAPLAWTEFAPRVAQPAWEKHARAFTPALAGVTVGEIATLVGNREFRKRLVACRRGALDDAGFIAYGRSTLGCVLSLRLLALGWTLRTQPGSDTALVSGAHEVRPFELWDDVSSRRLSLEAWRELARAAAIADVELATPAEGERLTELLARPLGSDAFPGIWWEPSRPSSPGSAGATFYGRRAPRPLDADDRPRAEALGYETTSSEATRWFSILWLPLVPLGTYRVIRPRRRGLPWLVQKANWNWRPIPLALLGSAVAIAAVAGILYRMVGRERPARPQTVDEIFDLGYAYDEGVGVARDPARAAELYTTACNAGQRSACYNLGLLLEPSDAGRAEVAWEAGCRMQDDAACMALGNLAHDRGAAGVDRALDFYGRACDLGRAASCVNLGNLHYTAEGRPRDLVRAREAWRRACEMKDDKGCDLLREQQAECDRDPACAAAATP